jgi:hypothetical protein
VSRFFFRENTIVEQGSADSKSTATPWGWPLWALQAWNAQVGALAPQVLTQPITFGNVIVTETNSSSPETERRIVAEESYGRQLGRLMDAVTALIDERPAGGPRPQAFEDLLELSRSIDEIKQRSVDLRAKRVRSDLARLKVEDPAAYRAIAAMLASDRDA